MLHKVYGESAMKKTIVYEWYKRFQDGRKVIENDERSGRPSTSIIDENTKKVEKMVMNDRRITTREDVDEVGISIGSFFKCFGHETSGRKVHSKTAEFRPKKTIA
ncbi:protein GVQW3-like [Hydra vulgaris]|uniref:Protein GVQW3-like n=1 Tax=Hydra vulgaris TaxID=6087 RepID=A0ABM4BYY5_HYDVU